MSEPPTKKKFVQSKLISFVLGTPRPAPTSLPVEDEKEEKPTLPIIWPAPTTLPVATQTGLLLVDALLSDEEEKPTLLPLEERDEPHSQQTPAAPPGRQFPPPVCVDTCCRENEARAPAQPVVLKKDTGRTYGSNTERYCNPDWYTTRGWLVLCSTRKRLICHICRFAAFRNHTTSSNCGDDGFSTTGVNNWKKCPQILNNHEKTQKHQDAVLKWLSYQRQQASADVQQLQLVNHQHAADQSQRREGILEVLKNLRFLVRQGIAIGAHEDKESNFHQLAIRIASGNKALKSFMDTGKYLSHDILNELLEHMYRISFNTLLTNIRGARHYAVIVDEIMDTTRGKEQLSISIRWVSKDYTVHEDFIGIHDCPETEVQSVQSITHTVEDILCRCGLDIMDMRGQTYDGAYVLRGKMSGVANGIKKKNPKALSIHCMNHSLTLILQEVASRCPWIQGALHLVSEIHEMIASSPNRLDYDIFGEMRAPLSSNQSVNKGDLKPTCPTRWTCRKSTVKFLLDNYEAVYDDVDDLANARCTSEASQKAPGVQVLMTNFEFHLGLKVFLHLFSTVEEVARVLQTKDISAEAVHSSVNILIVHYQGMRSEAFFHGLYESAKTELTQAPTLPRRRRTGGVPGEEFYRGQFFEVLDLLTSELTSRFDQPTLEILSHIEKVLLGAVNSSGDHGAIEVPHKWMADVDMDRLSTQLSMLPCLFTVHNDSSAKNARVTNVTSIATVVEVLAAAGNTARAFSEVDKLLRLYLTVPMASPTAETRPSGQLETCSSMTEKRLNHLLFMNVHKQLTDKLDLNAVLRDFCFGSDRRTEYFGRQTAAAVHGAD